LKRWKASFFRSAGAKVGTSKSAGR